MHLVFLDIDGVMTSVENGTSFLCENVAAYHLDDYCLGNILRLKHEFPDLKVVISSAWVNRCFDIDDPTPVWPWKNLEMRTPLPALHKFLEDNGLFFGALDNRSKMNGGVHVSKYNKIRDWIESRKDLIDEKNTKMLVLDDDASDYNELEKLNDFEKWGLMKIHFQQTDYKHGFDDRELKFAIEWMKS